MDQVKLIINGDDFGESPEVNEAVIRAFQAGTLTSCSLMVTGESFADAVRLARENEGLAVGLHLVTVLGKAVLPPDEIPTLVDQDGHFPDSPTLAGLKYYFSKSARRQLASELAAQFERFHATGLRLSHVDSHLHLHVHPVIFSSALELAERYGVRRMRVPRDDFWLAARFQRKDLVRKAIAALVFEMLTRRMKKQLRARGFSFAERVYGHFLSGGMSLDYTLFVLEHLSARTNEIYFHPAASDGGARSDSDQQQRRREFEVLLSSAFRDRLQNPDIKLTNYFRLATDT
jgi:chitin disaccharide deacetylase